MARSDDPRQRYRDARRRIDEGRGFVLPGPTYHDADAILETLDALDPTHPTSGDVETVANNTLGVYAERLRLFAQDVDFRMADADHDDVAETMVALARGDTDNAPDDGYADGTLAQYQAALRAFYRYHDSHGVDPEGIPIPRTNGGNGNGNGGVDPRDMFDPDEVDALRAAAGGPRERCLLELLIYTGQRVRVLQQLTIRDVEPSEGWLYIPDVDGTKGATGKRPLLGARKYVRDWLQYHPCADDPNAALLTTEEGNGGGGELGEPLSASTLRYHLNRMADRAGVDNEASDGGNRVRPHMFRHYFTTVAKRDYDLDDAHIKQLRGDAPESNVMETTYQHLTDEDAADAAREKVMGEEVERERTAFERESCPTCGAVLDAGAKACEECGDVFAPDAAAVLKEFEEGATERAVEVENEVEAQAVRAVLQEIREHPERFLSDGEGG